MPSEKGEPEKSEEEIDTNNERNVPEDKTKVESPITRSLVGIPDSILQEYRTSQKQQVRENKINRRIATAAVLSAWVYAGIAALQWYVMSSQLDEIRISGKQTDRLIKETGKQAEAARDNADTAKETVKAIQENIRLEQRAWVGVKAIRLKGQIEVGRKLEFEVVIENTGKTPGLQATIKKTFGTSNPTKELLNRPVSGVAAVFVVPPNNSFPASQTFSESLTNGEVKLLQSGTPVYLYGLITYKDVFKNDRKTYFCGFYNGKNFPSLDFCPILNEME